MGLLEKQKYENWQVGDVFALKLEEVNKYLILTLYEAPYETSCDIRCKFRTKITNNEHFIKLSNSNESKYINLDGKEISNIEAYPDNLLFAVSKDGKWGYTDKDGNIKVEAIYDKVTEFNKYGFAGVLKDGKWGIIKQDGTILVQPSYEIDSQIEPYFIGEYYQVKYGLGQMYYMK